MAGSLAICLLQVFWERRASKYLGNFYKEMLGNKSVFNGAGVDDWKMFSSRFIFPVLANSFSSESLEDKE